MKETNKSSHLMDLIILCLTPNRLLESQAVIAIFCLFWTREVSVWPVDVLNLKYLFYPSNLWFLYFRILGTFGVTDLKWLDLSPKNNGTSLQKRWLYFWKGLRVHLCIAWEVEAGLKNNGNDGVWAPDVTLLVAWWPLDVEIPGLEVKTWGKQVGKTFLLEGGLLVISRSDQKPLPNWMNLFPLLGYGIEMQEFDIHICMQRILDVRLAVSIVKGI